MICALRAIERGNVSVLISNFEIERDTSNVLFLTWFLDLKFLWKGAATLQELQIRRTSVKLPESDEIRGKETA
jgi:hypothetical protein